MPKKLGINAYITWALSESNPRHEKSTKSIEYLKNKLDSVDDNYTLSLIANALTNVEDKESYKQITNKLLNQQERYKRHMVFYTSYNISTKGIIEKYEISYTDVNIYLRNFEVNQIIDLIVNYRASYPVEITGLAIRAYDYYNPEIEGKSMPIEIRVNE